MNDEQLDDSDFGIRGIEKAAGFSPMPLADQEPPAEDLEINAATENFLATRDDPAPIVEREYRDVQSGERRPENETLRAEDAARNLSNARAAESRALEEQHNRDLQEALDQLRAPEPQPVAVDEQVTGRTELQPEYQPQPEAVQATDPNIDPELMRALQDPKIRGILEQVNQGVQQTAAQYQQQLADASLTAATAFLASFPELSGLRADQLAGAVALINQTNPARAQEIAPLRPCE
jgi:hypothetical protein